MPEPIPPIFAAATSRLLDVDGLSIHVRVRAGEGPSVVLLPGGILDSTALTWRYVLEALPEHYHVVVPDLPGYGRSAKPDVGYTTDFFIDVVGQLLDALGRDRVHLFGSSMSGATVLGFGLRHPERVASLGVSGAYGWQPRLPFHEAAYALARMPGLGHVLRRFLHVHPLVVRAALPVSIHRSERITHALVSDAYEGTRHPGALTAFLRWLRSELLPRRVRTDFTPELHRLEMPVLILHGEYDWTMPVRYARRAAALIPQADLHVFDTGHLVPRERPEAVTRTVLAFLRSVTA